MKHLLILLLFALPLAAQAGTERLRIGPGDLLSLEVFDVPELKQDIRVSDRGDAQFALIGVLHVADLTPAEGAQQIALELQRRQLVVAPHVSLLIREYATQGVAITGEIHKPGVYPVLGPRTLLQLLSEAGGLTETASPTLTVQHRSGEELHVPAKAAASTTLLIEPGDTVVVPRAGIAYLVGDVGRSGGYLLNDNGQLSLAQLIAVGGGLLPTAKASRARLVRKTATGCDEFEIDVKKILKGRAPDIPLQPDDILFVPNSAWRSAANRLQNITQMTAGAAIYTSLN